ncbi:hypothetical protein [Methylococcus mesophilus]|uniref:hypothetical protein n=1 Tax=Methylococcus mesophilus TaxID=2993564 RepID=UPI00224A5C0A|nr:hypothetical protein [Methylococcus mesophilus]UZR29047.1 hypothetical protein OOT43_00035 [Methylococcus mesophilus]
MSTQFTLDDINKHIETSKDTLDAIYQARTAGRQPIERLQGVHPLLMASGIEQPKTYTMVAQGDSWFDYPGNDIINFLRDRHGHYIENIAVAGSTLNDIVYGPVPKNWFGIPQSDDVLRIAELLHVMEKTLEERGALNAILLSGGGNDIAGPEFFSFLNNKDSGLQNPNSEVLKGVVDETFCTAYRHLIDVIFGHAQSLGVNLHIFIHGYDYPWPDGRGFTLFNLVGPWFHDSFNKKNYPYNNHADLVVRRNIVADFINSFNETLHGLEGEYSGTLHYINLRNTLNNNYDLWANELHPTQNGFGMLADKVNLALHQAMG